MSSASSSSSSHSSTSSSSSFVSHHPTPSGSGATAAPRPIHSRRAASYAHQPRARSIGCISSLPRTSAMSHSPSPAPSPAPTHAGRPGIPSSKSMTIYPHQVSSHRSAPPRASNKQVTSPSRLPQTETLSYFPPFESMGSDPVEKEGVGAEPSTGTAGGGEGEVQPRPTHAKGRSLGSIAGFVNSFGLFTRKTPAGDQGPTTPDGDALQALSKRVTPGKRKVLETISVANQDIKMATRRVSDGKQEAEGQGDCKGGVKAQAPNKATPLSSPAHPVDAAPAPSTIASKRPALHLPIPEPPWRVPIPSPPVTSISPLIPTELFSFFVDNPATTTSTATSPTPQSSPLSSSPPDSSQHLASTSRRSSSSSTQSIRHIETVLPAPIDSASISPVSSFSTLLDSSLDADVASVGSEPCTPEKSWVQGTIIPPTLAFSDSLKTFSSQLDAQSLLPLDAQGRMEALRAADAELEALIEDGYLRARQHRVRQRANSAASARSADSNRTIRPGTYAKEEITPKAGRGRGWRVMGDEEELDGVEYSRHVQGSPRWSIGPEEESADDHE